MSTNKWNMWVAGVVLTVATGVAGLCSAQDGQQATQAYEVAVGPNGQLAYFSPRLGARFMVQNLYVAPFGNFTAARIVSDPVPGSPLAQIGLGLGDVVTRLDGLPVVNYGELERHVVQTNVRYIRAGGNVVEQGEMYIFPNHYFQAPYDPNLQQGIPQVVLRP